MLIEYTAANLGGTIVASTDTLAIMCKLELGDGIKRDAMLSIEEDRETGVTQMSVTPADSFLLVEIKANQPRVVTYLRKRADAYADLVQMSAALLCRALADEIEHGVHLPAVTSW